MKLHSSANDSANVTAKPDSTIETRKKLADSLAQLRQPGAMPLIPNVAEAIEARIAPLDQRGQPGASRSVRIRDFDERGIAFHHELPLHDRRALVMLENPQLGRVTAEVDLSWCRFDRVGHYTSGGRFVQLHSRTA